MATDKLMSESTTWILKPFSALSLTELYHLLKVRNEVFIVEQASLYPDLDGKDLVSFHHMAWAGDSLAAYSRILPAGISFPEASIGRILTATDFRGKGLGTQLVAKSIEAAYRLFACDTIKIGAQQYLKEFYEGFGFSQTSEMYLEDDIPHIEMVLTTK